MATVLIVCFPISAFAEDQIFATQTIDGSSFNSLMEIRQGTLSIPLEVTDNSVSDSVYGDVSTKAVKIVYADVDFLGRCKWQYCARELDYHYARQKNMKLLELIFL